MVDLNIYDLVFLILGGKLTDFSQQLFSQNRSIIDIWQGPKYISEHLE